MMEYIYKFIVEFWNISCLMAPWLLFGFLIGGVIAVFVPDSLIRKHLGGRGFAGILKASLIGVPLPLCSCGVIPVAATLQRQGAGRGTVASFITSTPQIGFTSFLPAWQLVGPFLAIIKAIFALITGVLVGVFVNLARPEKPEMAGAVDSDHAAEAPRGNRIAATLKYAFITLMGDVGKTLLFGLAISALIGTVLPDDFGANYASNTWLVVPVMILISMPMYVCSNAAIPIAAMLLMKGFTPGAALAFLIAGPSCSAPMITSFWKLLGRRAALIYVGTMVGATLLVCWGIDLLGASIPGMTGQAGGHGEGRSYFEIASAVLMLGLMACNWVLPYWRKKEPLRAGAGQMLLQLPDMTCEHCAKTVTAALRELPEVELIKLDIPARQVLVAASESRRDQVFAALKDAGFEPAAGDSTSAR